MSNAIIVHQFQALHSKFYKLNSTQFKEWLDSFIERIQLDLLTARTFVFVVLREPLPTNVLTDNLVRDIVIKNFNNMIAVILDRATNNVKICIIANETDTSHTNEINFYDQLNIDELILIRYFEMNEVYRAAGNTNNIWNPGATKFLFLTGKATNDGRIGAFYNLLKAGLIHKCSWSLFIHNDDIVKQCHDKLKKLFPADNITLSEVQLLAKKYNRSVDDVDIILQTTSSHCDGHPYVRTVFADSLFSIVSETNDRGKKKTIRSPFMTEKTARHLLNSSPSIWLGETGFTSMLNNCNYKTFDYLYSDVKSCDVSYANIDDVVNAWYDAIPIYLDRIASDIVHNKQNLLLRSKESNELLIRFINDNNIGLTIAELLSFGEFYNIHDSTYSI